MTTSVSSLPDRWLKAGEQATTTVQGSDERSGIKSFELGFPGGGRETITRNCEGLSATATPPRCQSSDSATFTYGIDASRFPTDGRVNMTAKVRDAAGREAAPRSGEVRVDRAGPAIEPGGALWAARGGDLDMPRYELTFDVQDGSRASAAQERSGAKRVRVLVKKEGAADFVEKHNSGDRPCESGSCAINGSWTFETADYEPGARYTVRIEARDQLDQQSTSDFVVRVVDRAPPTVTGVTTSPSGWLKDGEQLSTLVSATDSHSGIKSFGLGFPGGPPASTITRACGGQGQPVCARSDSASFSYQVDASKFPQQGRVQISGRATDAAGGESAPRNEEVRIDRTPPKVALGGSLFLSKDTILVLDSYRLTLEAIDGSTESPSSERSGARQVKVFVKEKGAAGFPADPAYQTNAAACPGGSCEVRGEWTFQTASYRREQTYTVRVVGSDQLGHEAFEEFDVYVGKPLGQTLPLVPDRAGLEDFWQYESTPTGAGTQAHTNLQTGNLVWHATPIVNPGRGLSTVANLTYNSQESQREATLPENLAGDVAGQYNEVGRGFSLGISGVTRLNEPLDMSERAAGKITLTDADGTRHRFESSVGSDFNEVYAPPPGVQLHLRRWSPGLIDPITGLGVLNDRDKAYAMTRPDGVTYFFDQFGYATSIEDRNQNKITFEYEFRGPTREVCKVANLAVVSPDRMCVRKVVKVVDPARRALLVTYKARRIADLTANTKLVPSGGLPQALQSVVLEPDLRPIGGDDWRSGPVDQITDHKGRVYEFAYDDDGYLRTFTEAKGLMNPTGGSDERSWGFDYDADPDTSPLFKRKPLSAIKDPRTPEDPATPLRHATTFTYKSDSEVAGQENCGTQLDSTGDHGDGIVYRRRVKTLTDRQEQGTPSVSRQFSYSCAQEGQVEVHRAEVTDARNKLWRHKIDALGRPEEMTDPRATTTQLVWDGDNNPSRITRAAGSPDAALTQMAYNANGQLLESTNPEGHVTTLTYESPTTDRVDPTARLALQTPRTRLVGGGSFDAGRAFVTDLKSIERPEGGTTAFGYDNFGNATKTTDPRGFEAETAYDALGRVTDEWDQEENHTRYLDYDPNGMPGTVIDARNKTWRYVYDPAGNVTEAKDPRYDGTGCPSGRVAYRTELVYDAFDRVVRQFVPKDGCDFIQRDRRYDRNGNLTDETDGNRETRKRSYTVTDQLEEDRSPVTPHADGTTASEVSRREYDEEDNLVLQVSPRGMRTDIAEDFATRFEVDEVGRKIVATRQSRGEAQGEDEQDLTTSYAYDRRDNLIGLVDPAGNQTGDPLVNVGNNAKRRFTYTYDLADNRINEIQDPGGLKLCTKRHYDDNDRLAEETDPRGTNVNADGGCTLGEGESFTTRREYYEDDQLRHVTAPLGRRTTMVRRRDGKVTDLITPRGNATPDIAGDHTTKFTYWPTGEIKSRTFPYADGQYGSHDLKVQYAELNDVGDPTTVTDARGKAITNTYLASGQLKTTTRASWWALQGGQPQEKPPGQGGGQSGAGKPQTGGEGDFGGVERSPMPGILPAAGEAEFRYDDELRLTGAKHPDHPARHPERPMTEVRRDPLGRVKEIERPLEPGQRILEKYGYDFNGNRKTVTDPENYVTTSEFDQFDRVFSQTRPGSLAAETTLTDYFPNGTVKQLTTPRGTVASRAYDAVDRLIAETDPLGHKTTRGYDAAGNPVTERSPRGNIDPMPEGQQRSWFETGRRFNAANEMVKQTNGFGHEWNFEYDASGNQTRADAPGAARDADADEVRQVTERVFDGFDRPWRETTGDSANGGDRRRTRVFEYDPNGMPRRTVNPAGVNPVTRLPYFTYNNDADVDNQADASKNATVQAYNAEAAPDNAEVDPTLVSSKRLPWGDRDAADQTKYRQTFAYDDRGFLTEVDPPHDGPNSENGDSTYTYYDTGWIKSTEDDYKRLDYDYTNRGDQQKWTATKLGAAEPRRTVTRTYWPSGQLRERKGDKPATPGGVYRYTYDYNANRSLTKMHDFRKDRDTVYRYDDADRQVEVDESSFSVGEQLRRGKDTVLRYDPNGNVVGRCTDGLITGPGPTCAGGNANYTGGKVAEFTYDRLDRETNMMVDPAIGENRSTQTEWWASGQRKEQWTRRAASPNDTVERSFFFSDGQMARMDRRRFGAMPGSFAKGKDYSYDINGNRTADERGTHEFNSRDQLVRWTADQDDGGATTSYTVNGSGQIDVQQTSGTGGAPGSVTDNHYDYSDEGERLEFSETRATDTQAGQGTRTDYEYDPGGLGEVTRQTTEGQAPVTYSYDEFGRQTGSDNGQGKLDSYTHDGLDRRDTKTDNGKTFDMSYIGSSESLSQEQQFGGTETRSYDYDAQMDRLGMDRQGVVRLDANGYRAFSKDANGSVEGLEDKEGEVPEGDKYSYDPYGALTAPQGQTDSTGGGGTGGATGGIGDVGTGAGTGGQPPDNEPTGDAAKANPFRFQGHYYDTGVKTYDMQARPYSPQAGRFLTEDRYESAAGDLSLETDALTQDRYSFAGGNPINNIEYDGHEPIGSFRSCDPTYRSAHCTGSERKNVARQQRRGSGGPSCGDACSGGGYETTASDRSRPTRKGSSQAPEDARAKAGTPEGCVTQGKHDCLISASENPHEGEKRDESVNTSDAIHGALAGAGGIPVVGALADGADAAFYGVQGDGEGAALALTGLAASTAPVADQLNSAARITRLGTRGGDEAADATKAGGGATRALPRGRAELTQGGLEHIVGRHWATSGAKGAGKFAPGTSGRDLRGLIGEATQRGGFRPNTGGRPGQIFEHGFGSPIGTSMKGNATSRLRVVVGDDGRVVTAFPY